MEQRLFLRTTKFPYFFWSFNQAYECELNCSNNTYKNIERSTSYYMRPFNPYVFLILKYFPVLFVFYFSFSIYDLPLSKKVVVAYSLAFLLVLGINTLDNLMRMMASLMILLSTLILGFYIEDYFLVAYVLKYFLLLSLLLLFCLDCRLSPYSLLNENKKVVSHVLVPKRAIQ